MKNSKGISFCLYKCFFLIFPVVVSHAAFSQVIEKASSAVSPCSADKIKEVTAKADSSSPTVKIDCNLTLESTDTVTKRMILIGASATGVTINGNGAVVNGGKGSYHHKNVKEGFFMIEVRSKAVVPDEIWERPENVTIKNLTVIGNVLIRIADFKAVEESKKLGYVKKIRTYAPKNIVLDHLKVKGVAGDMIYFGSGVTYSKLTNSELTGTSTGVPLYLDAESYRNTIKDNQFHVSTIKPQEREVMAVDGSSYNIIMNNWFSGINHGGIYLYRNCGEKGRVRHSTPSYNQIINNVFYYRVYKGLSPAILLGARNGEGTDSYHCDVDKDPNFPYGSSLDNLDHAQYNVIMQNRIFKVPGLPSYVNRIMTINPKVNGPNYIEHNEYVEEASERRAGCYVGKGYKTNFILHGKSIDVFKNSKGEPICTRYKYSCNDGERTISTSNCLITKKNFDCAKSGSNNGCTTSVLCPSGQTIIGAKGAANLEFGSVSDNQLLSVPINNLKVVKASDNFFQGSSFIGKTTVILGQKAITGINGLRWVSVGCKEYDKNGGDCHIKGTLYCYGAAANILIVKQTSVDPVRR